jgi:hypothetical protein
MSLLRPFSHRIFVADGDPDRPRPVERFNGAGTMLNNRAESTVSAAIRLDRAV